MSDLPLRVRSAARSTRYQDRSASRRRFRAAASPYRHRNHPGRPRVGHLRGSPSARGDEMVSARWTPSASMVRCWCPRFTPALNKATMGIRGQSGWQSQRWKRHGAPSANASARHKSATRSIGSDIRAAYNGCSRLPDIGGLSFRTSVRGRTNLRRR